MKIDAIKKRLGKEAPGKVLGPFEIDLHSIRTDPTMQVRNRLDEGNKQRLRAAYKAGADVPPLLIAFIEGDQGLPVVVDGHHRLNVLETMQAESKLRGGQPIKSVQAKVVKLSRPEAQYQAARANGTHGLQLTPKETRRVFATYVRAGHHINSDGTFKSYREMGRDLSREHKTIITWMRKDFPAVFKKMERPEKATTGNDGPPPAPLVLSKHIIDARLLEIRGLFHASPSGDRHALVDGMSSLLAEFRSALEQIGDWQHDEDLKASRTRTTADNQPTDLPF